MPTDSGNGGNGKNKNLQLGIFQFPPIPKSCLPPGTDVVPPEQDCPGIPIIDHYQNRIENPVCPPEFFARALSGTCLHFNGTLPINNSIPLQFPLRFNRVIVINDSSTQGETLCVSFGGPPADNTLFPLLSGIAQFYATAYVYAGESRTFEVWTDTMNVNTDTDNLPVRISVFFP